MWAAMEAHDLDVLVLGRVANIRYASGVPILWNAGTRPFGPGCVAVRGTGDIYLMSTWDEGVPDDIPHDHLYGITWNPMNYVKVLQSIDAQGGRVGTDGMSPLFAQLLPMAFPDAAIVDGGPALSEARRIKTPEEIDAIRTAMSVADVALDAAVAELRPGVTKRELAGVFMDAMASAGITTPLTQDVARIVSSRTSDDGGVVQTGDVIAFHAGVVANGYSAEVGRTWPADPNATSPAAIELVRRSDQLRAALVGACTPGGPAGALLDVYHDLGEVIPTLPIGRGLGLGYDDPVVTAELPATAVAERLDPGVVVVITASVHDDAVGSIITHEPVLITPDGPEPLSASSFWQLESAGVTA
jgi:Xaa-Pro aminopeptidase